MRLFRNRLFGALGTCVVVLFSPYSVTDSAFANEKIATPNVEEQSKLAAARRHLANELPIQEEVKLALSAAPFHLRSGATVYVYTSASGYTMHRQGNNGFTCLVNRDGFLYGSRAFKPTCWDPNGKDSYVVVMLAVGRWLAAGITTAEIRARIDLGFDQGDFVEPEKVGIAYMLNGDVDLDLRTGRVLRHVFAGHLMIYAPKISNADIGATESARRTDTGLPVVFAGGAGGDRLSYIITMVGHVGDGARLSEAKLLFQRQN